MTDRIKALTFEPVGQTIKDVAKRLFDGAAVGVVLEPGDMTRYNLVLVGCWAPTIRSVCPGTEDGGDYILVSKVGDGCEPIGRLDHWTSLQGRGSVTQNEHSAMVISEFLGHVWKAIDAREAEVRMLES